MKGHRIFGLAAFGISIGISGLIFGGSAFGQEKRVSEVGSAEKLARIIVPRVEMTKAPLADTLEFLRIRSEDLDSTVPEGRPGRGLNFILNDPEGELGNIEVSLTLNRVPLKTVLDYIVRFAGATYRVDPNAVVIGKAENLAGEAGMILPRRLQGNGRRIFEKLRDTVLPAVSIQDATLGEAIQFFRAASVPRTGDAADTVGAGRLNIVVKNPDKPLPKITLHMKNIPLGTALRYACELSGVVYTVRPNAVAIGIPDDMIPQISDPGAHAYGRSGVSPGGAHLAAKLKGLVIPRVELSSASIEDTLDLIRGAALIAERKAGVEDPKGINIVNLSADNTQRVSLSLSNMPAWELMGYLTELTDTEFRVERLAVLVDWKLPRKTTAKKGEPEVPGEAPKVLEVPRVGEPVRVLEVPKLGEPVKVFEVPVLNRENRTNAPPAPRLRPGLGKVGGPRMNIPITPATPTAFEVRNVGVTMETEPVIGNDGHTIDLNISAEVVEFDGFVNYGNPIRIPLIRTR